MRTVLKCAAALVAMSCGPQFPGSDGGAASSGRDGQGGAAGGGGSGGASLDRSAGRDVGAGGGGTTAKLDAAGGFDAYFPPRDAPGASVDAAPDAPGPFGGFLDALRPLMRDAGSDRLDDNPRPRDAATDLARDSGATELRPGAREILIVATTTLSPGAAKLKDILEKRGFLVAHASGAAAETRDAVGKALLILVSDVTATSVETTFRDVPVPVMLMDPTLHEDMAMGTNCRSAVETRLAITKSDHPLAAGLSDTVTVAIGGSMVTCPDPPATAVKVATAASTGRTVIYAYAKDTMMVARRAPAKRIAFFPETGMIESLTSQGSKLLDAAVDWAVAP